MTDVLDTAAGVRLYLGQQDEVAARANVSAAAGTNGDLEGELRAASARTGVPLSTARAEPDAVKRRAAIGETMDTLRRFPQTLSFLADDTNNAHLAHDDTDALTRVEGALGATARYITGAPGSSNGLVTDLIGSIYGASKGAAGAMAVPFGAADDMLQRMDDAAAGLTGTPRRKIAGAPGPEGFLLDLGGQAGRIEQRLAPDSPDIVQGGVTSGVKSVGQTLAAFAAGGPGTALGVMAATQGGTSYLKAREKGKGAPAAAAYGLSDAVVEYATEKIPVGRLFHDLQVGRPLFATLWRQAATEIPGEQVATALQDLNEWAALNPDKPFADYLKERPSAAAQTLIATLIGTGGNVAVMHGIQNTLDTANGVDRQARALADLMAAAGDSKLRERDPTAFAAFVERAARGTDAPAEVFVDVKAFGEALAQSGVTLEQAAAAMPSLSGQMERGGRHRRRPGDPGRRARRRRRRLAARAGADAARPDVARGLEPGRGEGGRRRHEAARDRRPGVRRSRGREGRHDQPRRGAPDRAGRAAEGRPLHAGRECRLRRPDRAVLRHAGRATGHTPQDLYAKYPLKVQAAGTFGEALQQAYDSAPDNLMGFNKNGPQKGFGVQGYKHVQFVRVALPNGETFVDAIAGLNQAHALERARRNWTAATSIEPITRENAEAADPGIGAAVDGAFDPSTLKQDERAVVELRKRESVLKSLIECLT
jgi:hypothetical protein